MEDHELYAALAQDYYVNQLSLADLTDKYHLSRYLVNKYLEEARTSGIVTISIASPIERNHQLEQKFHELFDIDDIIIIQDRGISNGRENLIKYAATYIEQQILKSSVVGTLWGRTIYDVISQFTPSVIDGLVFTQFMGENRKYKSAAGSRRMVEDAAKKFSAEYITLSGPLYIVDDACRQGMKKEVASEAAFTAAKKMDMIFTGLGTFASVLSIPVWRAHTDEIFPDVDSNVVAGMIYGRPFDINGNILNQQKDTVFGIDFANVMKTPHRIGVVPSKFKSQATLGALRGKFFTDIILSEAVALRILSGL